jgi:hypothetical protein
MLITMFQVLNYRSITGCILGLEVRRYSRYRTLSFVSTTRSSGTLRNFIKKCRGLNCRFHVHLLYGIEGLVSSVMSDYLAAK